MRLLKNGFILIVPIFLWNVLLYKFLPERYYQEANGNTFIQMLEIIEHFLRAVIFVTPLLMIIEVKNDAQRKGVMIYLIGIIVYFLSWLMQITFPLSNWSQSCLGYLAPSYTPIIWLIGIGMIGSENIFEVSWLRSIYILLSICFTVVHTFYTYLIFNI